MGKTSSQGMRQCLTAILIISFIFNVLGPMPYALADDFRLPVPGVMIRLSPEFNPPMLKGVRVHPENPFQFDFILDKGDIAYSHPEQSEGSQNEQLKQESTKLIKYFLASLTIPDTDLWVNLSPYEKNRIIPQAFGHTEMGRDLLAEDYMLKQITASLMYPEDAIGKKFWKRVYEEAAKKFGTTSIPVNTFNKVWIIPEQAVIYENAKAATAYIMHSRLKVMLEEDYLSLQKHADIRVSEGGASTSQTDLRKNSFGVGLGETRGQDPNSNSIGSQVLREIIIPELTKEVNNDKNFAKLRQIYSSLILATWYKKKIKDSILEEVYANKKKVTGVGYEIKSNNLSSPNVFIGDPQHIYQQYLKAFKIGVYNYIKDEEDPISQQMIPRKYFSGGFSLLDVSNKAQIVDIQNSPARLDEINVIDRSSLEVVSSKVNAAMLSGLNDKIVITLPAHRLIAGVPMDMAKEILTPAHQSEHYDDFKNRNKIVGNSIIFSYVSRFRAARSAVVGRINKNTIRNGKILLNGEGKGLLAYDLINKGFKVWSNDISHQNTKEAHKLGVNQIVADANRLPYPDNYFDTVVFNESIGAMLIDGVEPNDLNHKPLREALRVLKPGGKIIIVTYPADEMGSNHDKLQRSVDSRYLYYSVDEIRSALNSIGIKANNISSQKISSESIPEIRDKLGFNTMYDVVIAKKPVQRFVKVRSIIRSLFLSAMPLNWTNALVVGDIDENVHMDKAQIDNKFSLDSNQNVLKELGEVSKLVASGKAYQIVGYHGRTSEVEKSKQEAYPETLGEGFYLTDKESAHNYADVRVAAFGGQPVVEAFSINSLKLLVLKDNRLPADLETAWRKKVYFEISQDRTNDDYKYTGRIFDIPFGAHVTELQKALQRRFSQFLESQGYEGLVAFESGEGKNARNHLSIVVFDRDRVKPVNKAQLSANKAMINRSREIRSAWKGSEFSRIAQEISIMTGVTGQAVLGKEAWKNQAHFDNIFGTQEEQEAMENRWFEEVNLKINNKGAFHKNPAIHTKVAGNRDNYFKKGGIDFTANKMNLSIQNGGQGIKFHIDPAMLDQLRNAPGFTPVIIDIRPLDSLPKFLGLNHDAGNTSV